MLQSELEDLCFAVVSPHEYRALRNELDRLWGLNSLPGIASPEESENSASAAGNGTSSSQPGSNGEQSSNSISGSRDASSHSSGTESSSSGSPCSKVVQSPSGVPLKLAEKPAASSSGAAAVLDIKRSVASSDSNAAANVAGASSAEASAPKLTQHSLSTAQPSLQRSAALPDSSPGSSTASGSTPRLVQDALDPPSSKPTDADRRESNALASSSGRTQISGVGSDPSLSRAQGQSIEKQGTEAQGRRRLTSRKEHWAAKAAATVVAEAARVRVSRDSAPRNLRRPPSLKLTSEQLEVPFQRLSPHNLDSLPSFVRCCN